MKNVLIITARSSAVVEWQTREGYIKEFVANIEAKLGRDDYKVYYTTFEELCFEVIDGKQKITDLKSGLDMAEFDYVQLKNWSAYTGHASMVGEYLSRYGKKFSNKEVLLKAHVEKSSQMFMMSWAGLPVPNSIFVDSETIANNTDVQDRIISALSFPLIMKDNDGSMGKKNYLIKDKTKMLEILNNGEFYSKSNKRIQYIFQNFIPNKGDVRLLFIGLELEPMIFVREALDGSHLNNTSQGGSAILVANSEFEPLMIEQSRKAAESLSREIAGVDIIIDSETQKHYFLEVNTTPAIATGFATEAKVDLFVEHIRHEIN